MASWSAIARRIRVPLGFVFAILYFWLAKPTADSILIGAALVIPGLVIRALASGHLQKNEQLATGGPYAYTRNPLYLGSLILPIGFALAARSWWIVRRNRSAFLCDLPSGDSFRRRHFCGSASRSSTSMPVRCPSLFPRVSPVRQTQRSVLLGPVLETPRIQRHRWGGGDPGGVAGQVLVVVNVDTSVPQVLELQSVRGRTSGDARAHIDYLFPGHQRLCFRPAPADRNFDPAQFFTSCA